MTIVVWITQATRYLDLVVTQSTPLKDLLLVSACLLPHIFFIITPAVAFLSSNHVFKKMFYSKELTVLHSFGVDKKQILKVFFKFLIFLTVIQYVISIFALPASMKKLRDIKNNVHKEVFVNLLTANRFISNIDGLTVHVGQKGPGNILKEIFIFDSRKINKTTTIIAQYGFFTKSQKEFFLELGNGSILEKTNETRCFSKFSKYNIHLDTIHMNSTFSKKDANEYFISELLFQEDFPRKHLLRYRAYGHFRVLWPPIIFSICVPTLILFSANIERGRSTSVTSMVILVLNKILFMLFYVLSYNSKIFPVFLYVLTIIFPLVLTVITFYKLEYKKK
jgi:lipopolysaccharide export LptBFGC system permease protein LptF